MGTVIVIVAFVAIVVGSRAEWSRATAEGRLTPPKTENGVTLNGNCSMATALWATQLQQVGTLYGYPGRLASVFCQRDGEVEFALVDYRSPRDGMRVVTWRPHMGVHALSRAMVSGK